MPQLILIFSLIFRLYSLVPLKPCLHPTTCHWDQVSQLVTSSNPLPALQSLLIFSVILLTYRNIFFITPKIHTIAVRSGPHCAPKIWCPLSTWSTSSIPLPSKTFKNQLNSIFSITHSLSTTQPASPSGFHHICLQPFTGQTYHKSCLFSLVPSPIHLLFTPICLCPHHSKTAKITNNLSMSPNPKDVFYSFHLTIQKHW